MSFLYRQFVFPLTVLFGLVSIQPASASSILVFGDGFSTSVANNLVQTLTGLGHTVNNSGAAALTDADFVGVDTAWYVGSNNASFLSGTTLPALQNFLNGGGGLHLTGENASFAGALNTALLDNLVNPFITDAPVVAGGNVFGSVTVTAALPADVEEILNTPNLIAGMGLGAIASGELVGVDAGNVFAANGSGQVVGAIYGPNDLIVPDARLSIIMDMNWLVSSGSTDVIENLQLFLEGGATVVAMPEPGTGLLLASAGFLVVSYRRRKRR